MKTAFDVKDRNKIVETFTTREKAYQFVERNFHINLEITRTSISWIEWFLLKIIRK